MLLLHLTGPYLGVVGAVFTDKAVCQPLTAVLPLYYVDYNYRMMQDTARVFRALKIALTELRCSMTG